MGSVGRLLGLLTGTATAFAAAQAHAHGFAGQGRAVVSLERITGVSYDTYEIDAEDSDRTTTVDSFSVGLLGVDAQGLGLIPRVAFDYFIDGRVTVGLGGVYLLRGGTTTVDDHNGAPSQKQDNPTLHTVLVNPRLGYVIPIGYRTAIWPRLGATWLGEWERVEDDRSHLNLIDLSFDALWVTKIADFLTLSAGPFLDLGLFGRYVTHQAGATRSEYATATSAGLSVCVSGLLYGF